LPFCGVAASVVLAKLFFAARLVSASLPLSSAHLLLQAVTAAGVSVAPHFFATLLNGVSRSFVSFVLPLQAVRALIRGAVENVTANTPAAAQDARGIRLMSVCGVGYTFKNAANPRFTTFVVTRSISGRAISLLGGKLVPLRYIRARIALAFFRLTALLLRAAKHARSTLVGPRRHVFTHASWTKYGITTMRLCVSNLGRKVTLR